MAEQVLANPGVQMPVEVIAVAPSQRIIEYPIGQIGEAVRSAASCTEDAPTATSGWRLRIELSKPRITRLVTMTSLGGLGLSVVGRGIANGSGWQGFLPVLAGCIVGTALSSAGANALNQCMEISRDGRMNRTAGRPLPSGRMRAAPATAFGIVMCILGLAVLWALCGPGAALVSLATILSYLLWYTPLKPVTSLNTWVGAIPGALPPLIGWSAGAWLGMGGWNAYSPGTPYAGLTEAGGWSLFALMFVWQIPHFLAIAWTHKDDYKRGGYRMLPLHDESGRKTVIQIILWAVLLIPATMSPWLAMPTRISAGYAIVALLSGVAFLSMTTKLINNRSPKLARRVFIASIIHLPVLLVALVIDATVKAAFFQ